MKSAIGTLYLIPTVLAEGTQHEVLPPMITRLIGELDYFAVENLRSARRFIRSVDKEKVIDELEFFLLDKRTNKSALDKLIEEMLMGRDVGILSEAGCPGVADPGALLANAAHEQGIKVVPVVGPSSILLALMASGMNGQSFTFHGYLPIPDKERIQAIKAVEREVTGKNQTQIFMETPYRNDKMLQDLVKYCQPNTLLCIACNITAEDEYIETMPIQDWKKMKVDLHKKPVIFVLGR